VREQIPPRWPRQKNSWQTLKVLEDGVVVDVLLHFGKNFEANFTAIDTNLVSNLSLPVSILLVLIEFCKNEARCIKTDGF
jgi:hypothetical protein